VTTFRLTSTLQRAAMLRLAASSVAPVAGGYERALRPCDAGISRLAGTIQTEGDH
jgi:hypothetical protein